MISKSIIWFRQDLRLHDNEALTDAIRCSDLICPVYVFDPRVLHGRTRFGFRKTEKFRAKFIIESVQDLRESLRAIGSELIVRTGKPEEEIFLLAKTLKTNWVFCNRERTRDEVFVQDKLEENLWSVGQEIRFSRGKMLYYTQDLPFPITHTPDSFGIFRKEIENLIPVRDPLPTPDTLPSIPKSIDPGNIPSLSDLHYQSFSENGHHTMRFEGGETSGLARLKHYIWDARALDHYNETRNHLLGVDYSSKFSPWLSQGCISPKLIFNEIKKYESQFGENESTYKMFFELLWRDFFRLMGKKHTNKIFLKGGIKEKARTDLSNNYDELANWILGKTGVPLVDANMKEISRTGFMSNRGRQIVASFLINDLKVNWQMGAEYFESILLDYDPCSNYGNWIYLAGVGNDPRKDRYFNILSQARKYDPDGEYMRKWLPDIAEMTTEALLQLNNLENV